MHYCPSNSVWLECFVYTEEVVGSNPSLGTLTMWPSGKAVVCKITIVSSNLTIVLDIIGVIMFNFLKIKPKIKVYCIKCTHRTGDGFTYYCEHPSRGSVVHDYITGKNTVHFRFCTKYNINGDCKLFREIK